MVKNIFALLKYRCVYVAYTELEAQVSNLNNLFAQSLNPHVNISKLALKTHKPINQLSHNVSNKAL